MGLLKQFKNEAEVEAYQKETGKKVIIFEGTIYEVGDYMETHPGGKDLIEKLIGKCIDEDFYEAEHTKSARNIFRDLEKIGHVDSGHVKNDVNSGEVGLDGFKLESKIKLDYDRGMFA